MCNTVFSFKRVGGNQKTTWNALCAHPREANIPSKEEHGEPKTHSSLCDATAKGTSTSYCNFKKTPTKPCAVPLTSLAKKTHLTSDRGGEEDGQKNVPVEEKCDGAVSSKEHPCEVRKATSSEVLCQQREEALPTLSHMNLTKDVLSLSYSDFNQPLALSCSPGVQDSCTIGKFKDENSIYRRQLESQAPNTSWTTSTCSISSIHSSEECGEAILIDPSQQISVISHPSVFPQQFPEKKCESESEESKTPPSSSSLLGLQVKNKSNSIKALVPFTVRPRLWRKNEILDDAAYLWEPCETFHPTQYECNVKTLGETSQHTRTRTSSMTCDDPNWLFPNNTQSSHSEEHQRTPQVSALCRLDVDENPFSTESPESQAKRKTNSPQDQILDNTLFNNFVVTPEPRRLSKEEETAIRYPFHGQFNAVLHHHVPVYSVYPEQKSNSYLLNYHSYLNEIASEEVPDPCLDGMPNNNVENPTGRKLSSRHWEEPEYYCTLGIGLNNDFYSLKSDSTPYYQNIDASSHSLKSLEVLPPESVGTTVSWEAAPTENRESSSVQPFPMPNNPGLSTGEPVKGWASGSPGDRSFNLNHVPLTHSCTTVSPSLCRTSQSKSDISSYNSLPHSKHEVFEPDSMTRVYTNRSKGISECSRSFPKSVSIQQNPQRKNSSYRLNHLAPFSSDKIRTSEVANRDVETVRHDSAASYFSTCLHKTSNVTEFNLMNQEVKKPEDLTLSSSNSHPTQPSKNLSSKPDSCVISPQQAVKKESEETYPTQCFSSEKQSHLCSPESTDVSTTTSSSSSSSSSSCCVQYYQGEHSHSKESNLMKCTTSHSGFVGESKDASNENLENGLAARSREESEEISQNNSLSKVNFSPWAIPYENATVHSLSMLNTATNSCNNLFCWRPEAPSCSVYTQCVEKEEVGNEQPCFSVSQSSTRDYSHAALHQHPQGVTCGPPESFDTSTTYDFSTSFMTPRLLQGAYPPGGIHENNQKATLQNTSESYSNTLENPCSQFFKIMMQQNSPHMPSETNPLEKNLPVNSAVFKSVYSTSVDGALTKKFQNDLEPFRDQHPCASQFSIHSEQNTSCQHACYSLAAPNMACSEPPPHYTQLSTVHQESSAFLPTHTNRNLRNEQGPLSLGYINNVINANQGILTPSLTSPLNSHQHIAHSFSSYQHNALLSSFPGNVLINQELDNLAQLEPECKKFLKNIPRKSREAFTPSDIAAFRTCHPHYSKNCLILMQNGYDIRLGEVGRAALKKEISRRLKGNSELREKCVSVVCRLKNANVLQLLQMAEISGCLALGLKISSIYWKEYSRKQRPSLLSEGCSKPQRHHSKYLGFSGSLNSLSSKKMVFHEPTNMSCASYPFESSSVPSMKSCLKPVTSCSLTEKAPNSIPLTTPLQNSHAFLNNNQLSCLHHSNSESLYLHNTIVPRDVTCRDYMNSLYRLNDFGEPYKDSAMGCPSSKRSCLQQSSNTPDITKPFPAASASLPEYNYHDGSQCIVSFEGNSQHSATAMSKEFYSVTPTQTMTALSNAPIVASNDDPNVFSLVNFLLPQDTQYAVKNAKNAAFPSSETSHLTHSASCWARPPHSFVSSQCHKKNDTYSIENCLNEAASHYFHYNHSKPRIVRYEAKTTGIFSSSSNSEDEPQKQHLEQEAFEKFFTSVPSNHQVHQEVTESYDGLKGNSAQMKKRLRTIKDGSDTLFNTPNKKCKANPGSEWTGPSLSRNPDVLAKTAYHNEANDSIMNSFLCKNMSESPNHEVYQRPFFMSSESFDTVGYLTSNQHTVSSFHADMTPQAVDPQFFDDEEEEKKLEEKENLDVPSFLSVAASSLLKSSGCLSNDVNNISQYNTEAQKIPTETLTAMSPNHFNLSQQASYPLDFAHPHGLEDTKNCASTGLVYSESEINYECLEIKKQQLSPFPDSNLCFESTSETYNPSASRLSPKRRASSDILSYPYSPSPPPFDGSSPPLNRKEKTSCFTSQRPVLPPSPVASIAVP